MQVTLERALCAGRDTDMWFRYSEGDRGAGGLTGPALYELNDTNNERARRICSGCLDRTRCLTKNLTLEFGIFGGLDPAERAALAREGAA